jgi:AcrR family transcriptional regulator
MEVKRKAVLDTATELFSVNGYHAVGVDRIIAESGVAKMTMYRHFPSKNFLVVEVLKERTRVRQESLTGHLEGIEDPVAQLKAVFRWYDQRFRSPSFAGCMFAHAASEFNDKACEIHQVSVEEKQQLTAFLRDILKQLLSTRKATELARVLIMLLDGASLTAQIYGRKTAAMEAWDAARKLLDEAQAEQMAVGLKQ